MVTITYEPHYAQNDKTNGSIEFLQPYLVAADAPLEIDMAIISAVLLLHERLSQNFVTSWCIVSYLYLLGYTLLNAPRILANNFDTRWNTCSACKYTMLCNWHEQQPSNEKSLTCMS
jgi:hypothetical protein